MTSGQISASAGQYLAANGMNVPPPPIASDPLVAGAVPIEQLLRILGLAANLGDPKDNAESAEEHAKRDAKTADAAAKFPAQDEQAAAEMKGVAGQGDASQMAQQLPQMASGIAGALAGAMGGMLQPLTQMPQQLAQGAQQAMQAGMGMMQQAGGATLDKAGLTDAPLDELGETAGELGAGGGGGGAGGGGLGGTTPMSMLGPPPVPAAGTSPSSAPAMTTPPAKMAAPGTTPTAGMGGMPMMPPGAMHGGGGSEKDTKADTKRVSVPTVKNGAPVQGRIATPPPEPQVTKKVDGKPVATKRIILPNTKPADEAPEPKS
ncbi:hypothetical protein ACXDF8_24130 [Mycolicibacterium sp. CBM1]